jgi:hypothetical protein
VLIDDFLPQYDVFERHETEIDAPIERVYPFIRALDLRYSFLSSLYRLAERAAGPLFPRKKRVGSSGLSMQIFLDYGFVLLGERPLQEVVIGLTERVGLGDRVRLVQPEEFKAFSESGFAKAAWNFSLFPLGTGQTRLVTETRVLCLDPRSRRRFLVYWRAIRFFSGLIRIEFLRALKKAAEMANAEPRVP